MDKEEAERLVRAIERTPAPHRISLGALDRVTKAIENYLSVSPPGFGAFCCVKHLDNLVTCRFQSKREITKDSNAGAKKEQRDVANFLEQARNGSNVFTGSLTGMQEAILYRIFEPFSVSSLQVSALLMGF
jgi:hypothetical protein